jgi:hypothetical protein
LKGYGEPLVLEAYTTAWVVGTDESRLLGWPSKAKAQMWQMVPFYERMFDDYGCKGSAASDEATATSIDDGSVFEAVRVFRECPFINDPDVFIKPLSQVLLDHVDLHVADRDSGFPESFTRTQKIHPIDDKLAGKSVIVGRIDVPRLNIVGSAIAGGIAVIVFIVVSRMPDFDTTEAVIEHYDTLKAMYEHSAGDADNGGEVSGNVDGVNGNLDADVEGGGMKA